MQIRTRLTIQFFFISSSLLLMALLAIYFFSAKHQKEEFYSRLKSRANTSAELLLKVDEVDSSLLKLIDINRKDILYYENISIYDSNDKEIYTNNDNIHFHEILPDIKSFLGEVRQSGEKSMTVENLDYIGIKYEIGNKKYVVIACAMDIYGIDNLKSLRRILVFVFVFFLLAMGVSGWIYAGRALKPISEVVHQVNSISANSLNQRLEERKTKDEIYQLTSTFNEMLQRIEHAFKTQKTFVANASHELRNPLTVITAQLEVALIKERNSEEYKKIIESVLEDIKRLNDISHRLLQLTKIESERSDIKLESIRIDDLIWEVKKEFQNQNPGYKVILKLHELPESESQLIIFGNAQFLKTCFINLMSNACKFSLDKTVHIDIISSKGDLIINFIDHGMGISQDDLPFVFEPFYRGKNVAQSKGYGIGLSIVEKIIKAHNAEIQVNSKVNSGTTVSLIFPIH